MRKRFENQVEDGSPPASTANQLPGSLGFKAYRLSTMSTRVMRQQATESSPGVNRLAEGTVLAGLTVGVEPGLVATGREPAVGDQMAVGPSSAESAW